MLPVGLDSSWYHTRPAPGCFLQLTLNIILLFMPVLIILNTFVVQDAIAPDVRQVVSFRDCVACLHRIYCSGYPVNNIQGIILIVLINHVLFLWNRLLIIYG